jgi:hypothetical protein
MLTLHPEAMVHNLEAGKWMAFKLSPFPEYSKAGRYPDTKISTPQQLAWSRIKPAIGPGSEKLAGLWIFREPMC